MEKTETFILTITTDEDGKQNHTLYHPDHGSLLLGMQDSVMNRDSTNVVFSVETKIVGLMDDRSEKIHPGLKFCHEEFIYDGEDLEEAKIELKNQGYSKSHIKKMKLKKQKFLILY